MAEQLGQAVLTISADTRQLDAGLQRARQQAEALRGAFAQIAGGLSIAGSLAFVGNQIKELDAASAAVRTLGVNSDDLATKLKALSLELGSSVSQIQLTKAAYDVASSGFADAASAAQVLKASALGAQGGFAQLDDVVRAVTGVLNAYGLSADKATGIVDQFLQTQNDGVITVRQYAAEIGNIASIAAAGGVGLDQLNAAVATATLRGVPVAQTFTGLRQALSSIIKPSQQAAELAASLGLQFNVSALQSKGLAGVLADVQRATGGSADKIAILLGSVEAQAAVQPLLNDRLAKYNELLAKQANANGAAAAAAKINATTISGGLAQIGNGFSNLATSLDKTLNPLLGGFIKSINEILTKLNQVAALAPDRVLAREKEATDIVQRAIGPFGGSGFFGGVTVKYKGKTYKGSATGVRNDIINDLLQQELAAVNGPKDDKNSVLKPEFQGKQGVAKLSAAQSAALAAAGGGAVLSPAEQQFQQRSAALELRGLQEKLEVTRQLVGLDDAQRTALQNRLALNEKLRDVQRTQLSLELEQAKPKGAGTGSPAEQDPKKIQQLQDKLQAGQVEVATLRLQNQQADAAALRTQQDRLRGQSLEAANARAKLNATQQQTQLERQALAAGVEVSRTAQLRLQQEESIAAAKRQQASAQQALDAELQKPIQQQDRVVVDDLFSKVARANEGVRQAYADAGLALVQRAREAASELKSAAKEYQSALEGNFQFLPDQLRAQAIANAQSRVQRGVDAGLIRTGLDISTPDKLFAVARASDQLLGANERLQEAIAQNAAATLELVRKNWEVYVSVPGQPTFVPLSNT